MKKSIGIISHRENMAQYYQKQLEPLFGDTADIFCYSIEKETIRLLRRSDIFLQTLTSYDMMKNPWVYEFMPQEEYVVKSNVNFSKAAVELLETYPKGTKGILVNQSLHMTLESISQLYHLGIDNIEFFPFYPGAEIVPDTDLVFSTGEPDLIPEGNYHVVDLGTRLISANTICEIALKLNDPFFIESYKFKKYREKLAKIDYSLQKISSANITTENKMEIILNALDDGVICLDEYNRVSFINKTARKITGVSRSEVLKKPAAECFSFFPYKFYDKNDPYGKLPVLINIRGVDIGASIRSINIENRDIGSFITLQNYSRLEKLQTELCLQMINKQHTAKFVFKDIIGKSSAITTVKNIAEKTANSDAPILIEGPVGTGKTVFAHAVHNASPRRGMPFIAVKCASIKEDSLENELLGYAENVYSGSRSSGKAGLIECANNGTLFLDGIDSMSDSLQANLVKILEDGVIGRIGSEEVIPIDIRIISSTNENLEKMILDGKFRKDLYYRLNVITIKLPTLTERREDIPLLIDYFMMKLDANYQLSINAKLAMSRYKWDGNVRELQNCIEYLKYLKKPFIDTDDLPEKIKPARSVKPAHEENGRKDFDPYDSGMPLSQLIVLKILGRYYTKKKHAGRRTIMEECRRNGDYLSEYEIRAAISELYKVGLVTTSPGRSGTNLTEQGYLKYCQLKQD